VHIDVYADERQLAHALADAVTQALHADPGLVLGLPTGRTPVRLYEELAARVAAGAADFSRATTFNIDEFVGLPADHPGSYRQFMETHLFSRIDLPAGHINFLDGMAPDPAAECARYEAAIEAAGGLDLLILGIGRNGHIGFNEPGPELTGPTHRTRIHPGTIASNADLFNGDVSRVPPEALTMGIATLLKSRRIVLAASGGAKADAVRRMIDGPVTTMLPASLLQLHPDVRVMLDEEAAGQLRRASH